MRNEVNNNKFTWVIKNFSSLESEEIYSDDFVIGGCKWFLSAYPKGIREDNCLSLYLKVVEPESLPCGWRRHAKYSFMIVNQTPQMFSQHLETQDWFNDKAQGWGFESIISLNELKAKDSGYLVNGELKIVVDIDVLEVVGQLDVVKVTSAVKEETMDVNGFHVLPSQVESVQRIFNKHPDIALKLRAKNQLLRTVFMNIILSVIETFQKPLQELVYGDLVEADSALSYMKESGFKVEWLEKKLGDVKAKKKEEQIYESRVQELDKELKDCKRKWSDIEAELEKAKAKVLATRAHLAWDDFA